MNRFPIALLAVPLLLGAQATHQPSPLPDASPTRRGAVSTGNQAFAGDKTAPAFHSPLFDGGTVRADAGHFQFLYAGSITAAGSPGQVQFNSGGTLAGTPALLIDGGVILLPAVTTHPAAPIAGEVLAPYAYHPAAGLPPSMWTVDPATGSPMPVMTLSSFAMSGVNPTWRKQCCFPGIGATSTAVQCSGDDQTAPSATAGTAGVAWDAGNYYGRNLKFLAQTVGTTNTNAGWRMGVVNLWRGNTGGAGGFVWWGRFALGQVPATVRLFMGLKFGTANAVTANNNPSVETNTVYLGRDPDAGNGLCNVCSNDGTGSATCSELDGGFPCNTSTVGFYDVWLWAQPSDGGTGAVDYYVQRLDDPSYTARGTIAADLPINYAQAGWQAFVGSAYVSATAQLYFVGVCSAWNF
jgi:hypothetical protein